MLDRIPTPLYSAAAVALSLAGMFVLAGVGSPGPDGATDVPEAPLMEAERGPAASGDGTAEGIKVHGHWTIEVREPDGELVTRREFENALVAEGGDLLVFLLARQRSPGTWRVVLDDESSPPCRDGPDLRPCVLLEAHTESNIPFFWHVLQLGMELHLHRLTLSGTVAAQRTGRVSKVVTLITTCGPTASPTQCGASVAGTTPFTETFIDPIDVLNGQSIHVTVSISFS